MIDFSDVSPCMAIVGRLCPWTKNDDYHTDGCPERYLHYLDYNAGMERAFHEVFCSVVFFGEVIHMCTGSEIPYLRFVLSGGPSDSYAEWRLGREGGHSSPRRSSPLPLDCRSLFQGIVECLVLPRHGYDFATLCRRAFLCNVPRCSRLDCRSGPLRPKSELSCLHQGRFAPVVPGQTWSKSWKLASKYGV